MIVILKISICKIDSHCTGCGLCKNICPYKCISMELRNGFYYPKIDNEKCINCGLCSKMCPINEEIYNDGVIKAYAAYDLDDKRRLTGSSGGIFGLIAERFIRNGGIVYGAIYDENLKVVHKGIETIDELHLLKTSKYSQSNCNDVYNSIKNELSNNRKVLFSGTPCQVAALKKLCKSSVDLYTIDFVCHSVPSPELFEKYIISLEKKYSSKIKKFNFRDKCTGWEHKKFSIKAEFENGKLYESLALNDPFFRAFVFGVICRDSCEYCHFKSNKKMSDITIADFWGVWDYLPEISNDKGASLVMVNNKQGDTIFEKISNDAFIKQVNYNDMHKLNPAINNSFIPIHNQKTKINILLNTNIETYIGKLIKSTKFSILDRIIMKFNEN